MDQKSESPSPTVELADVQQAGAEGEKGLFLRLRNKLSPPTNQGPLDSSNYLADHQHEYGDYTPEEAERIRKKIDWRMVPLQLVTSTISGIDVSHLGATTLNQTRPRCS